jgi:hypothetical protein
MIQGLEQFDELSVARGAAALALWPTNADRHVATGSLIHAIGQHHAAFVDRSGRPIDAAGWRAWFEGDEGARLQAFRQDGFHDSPLWVSGTIIGRPIALIAGDLEAPDLQYRLYAGTLAAMLAERRSPELVAAFRVLATAAGLSNRMIIEAGVQHDPWPRHGRPTRIEVPDDALFERLSAAVVFSPDEIASNPWIDDTSLALLVRMADVPLAGRPLAALADGGLLVADPWRLTSSGLAVACAILAAAPERLEFVARMREAALSVADEAAADMDWATERITGTALRCEADVDVRVVVSVFAIPPEDDLDDTGRRDAPQGLTEAYADADELRQRHGAAHALVVLAGYGSAFRVPDDHDLTGSGDAHRPWILGLGELRLIGDAVRRDPLALPLALERGMRPPWPDDHDLADIVGHVRLGDAPPHEHADLTTDGTELLQRLALVMAARHATPAPEPGDWTVVTRWEGLANRQVFSDPGRLGVALAVEGDACTAWVIAQDPLLDRHTLVGVTCVVLALWLSRLLATGWPRAAHDVTAERPVLRFIIELDDRPGPALAIVPRDRQARIVIGPAFAHAFALGDNDAERMLLSAVIGQLADRPAMESAVLLDEVAPRGDGTLMIWPAPEARSNRPRYAPPPLVPARDRVRIAGELAQAFVGEQGVLVVQGPGATKVLSPMVAALETGIEGLVAELRPDCLLELVRLAERATAQRHQEGVHLPARAVLADAEDFIGAPEADDARDVALRALIERIAAAPPSGPHPLGLKRGGLLRATTELQLTLGSAHDLARTGAGHVHLMARCATGVVVTAEGELPDASNSMREQMEASAPSEMRSEHEAWWTGPPRLDERPALNTSSPPDGSRWDELDRAAASAWGVGFEQLLRVMRALHHLADNEDDGVATRHRDSVVSEVTRVTEIDEKTVGAAIDHIILDRIDPFSITSSEHAPWRHNRERSYLRRPLVRLADGRLAWAAQHLITAIRYLFGLVHAGRLQTADPTLQRAGQRLAGQLDRDFEVQVRDRVRQRGWDTGLRVTELGGVGLKRPSGQPIGDIDVLAWSALRRRVWLLDAKRIFPGLGPGSMVTQSRKLLEDERHHLERLGWVLDARERLSETIGHDVAGWDIDAALVLDRPLAAAHFRQLRIAAWPLWELPERLGPGA